MGRISKALTVHERWRSLAYQGVEYLYAPEGSALRELIESAKISPVSHSGTTPVKINISQPGLSSHAPHPVISAPPVTLTGPASLTGQDDQSAQPVVGPGAPKPQPSEAVHAKPAPVAAPAKSAAGGFADPDWPGLWRGFAAKAQTGRPLLWTYPEAGLDLSGQGDKARSELIRAIISRLKLPAGSSNFWPHRSRPEEQKDGETGYFRQGLEALNPKFILVFGELALGDISPGTTFKKYTYISFEGRLLLMLPDMSELALQTDASQELDACLVFLSTFAKPLQRGG